MNNLGIELKFNFRVLGHLKLIRFPFRRKKNFSSEILILIFLFLDINKMANSVSMGEGFMQHYIII